MNTISGFPSADRPWLKFYSSEAVQSELPQCTIDEYAFENNKEHQDRTALNYFGRRISYGELFANIEKTARALCANGVRKGSIVTILMPTVLETAYLF